MPGHPFRSVTEEAKGPAALAGVLAPDVSLKPQLLATTWRGRDKAISHLTVLTQLVGAPQYFLELANGGMTVLLWNGGFGGRKIQGATVLRNRDGLVSDIMILMRPWPVLSLVREAMQHELGATTPAADWGLGEKPETGGLVTETSTIKMVSPVFASDMQFHSPMLSKTLIGGEKIEAGIRVVHEIQHGHGFQAIFATPSMIVELFDFDVEGYPGQGINHWQLDGEGRAAELSVYLRPFPVVTLLRKAVIARNIPFLPTEFWTLPDA